MNQTFYLDHLYPFQDQVLAVLKNIDTGMYLSGGTALSRCYLNHRFSEDLDFFVNDEADFQLWADRFVQALSHSSGWDCKINQREERYFRISLQENDINLKIELINDVPSRIGKPWLHPVLGRIDTAENILANKITAVLNREAPKDLADIWGLCCNQKYSICDAIVGAQGKAAGIFPVDLARVLCSVTISDWELVQWLTPPDPDLYIQQLNDLGKSLILINNK
jgi:hypothetical protein